MAIRKTPLATNEIYHVYNRSVAQQPIFTNNNERQRFLDLIDFYRFKNNPLRFSNLSKLSIKNKEKYLTSLRLSKKQIKIYSFSTMPNHYHLLLKQIEDFGITNFIKLIQNSYAKYFNLKTKRSGALFLHSFKATRIETEEQFLHTARYIHLNQLTSFTLKKSEGLKNYKWNSYTDYASITPRPFVDTETLINLLGGKDAFTKFTLDRLDYQRSLEKIKHSCHSHLQGASCL